MIKEIKERLGVPVIAGKPIRTMEEVEGALESGTSTVTTSRHFHLHKAMTTQPLVVEL